MTHLDHGGKVIAARQEGSRERSDSVGSSGDSVLICECDGGETIDDRLGEMGDGRVDGSD